MNETRSKDQIIEIARRFGIVTENTSFLVLETLEQYLEYQILPPTSLPKIREQYLELITSKKIQKQQKDHEQFLQTLDLWNRRVLYSTPI